MPANRLGPASIAISGLAHSQDAWQRYAWGRWAVGTNGLIRIFYINLDRRDDRREFMEGEFGRLGLPAERMAAVTPDALPPLLPGHRPRSRGLTEEELACSCSHRKAWERVLALGLPHALIMEDDVVLSARLPAFLKALRSMPEGVEIIRLETRLDRIRADRVTDTIAGIELRRPLSAQWGMAAYVITAECARRLLSDPRFFDVAIDHLFLDPDGPFFSSVEVRQCFPGLCIPGYYIEEMRSDQRWNSDIEPERRRRFDAASGPALGQFGKIRREVLRIRRQMLDQIRWSAQYALRGVARHKVGYAGKAAK